MPAKTQKSIRAEEWRRLRSLGWAEQVGTDRAIWVNPRRQCVMLLEGRHIIRAYPCSTATAGLGSRRNSFRTPTGWHAIGSKVGGRVPIFAILKARRWTKRVWRPGDSADADMVLSRILRLKGLEAGVNLGGELDTWQRFIYLHGTNAEHQLGRPASRGCIRLSNRDVIDLYDLVSVGCKVLITE